MDNSNENIITSIDEVYKIMPKGLENEYSIGFHGIDKKISAEQIKKNKEIILSEGLTFKGELLSTVRFENLDLYINAEDYYSSGGIIVSLPKVLRSTNGECFFIGAPNEMGILREKRWWDRNSEPTSLSEILLSEEGRLDSKYILGSYQKKGEGIVVNLNPNHIAFNKGVIPEDEYRKIINSLKGMIEGKTLVYNGREYDENSFLVREMRRQQEEYLSKLENSAKEHFLQENSLNDYLEGP